MRATFCLFAKPPKSGSSKTRLGRVIGHDNAARLASAFLTDSWNALTALPWADSLLSSTESQGFPINAVPWLQCDGDLGAKIEHTLRHALITADFAFAVGADSPGIPPRLFEAAKQAMGHHDAIIGPCEDGGFYLLGLKKCPPGLLAELPWSHASTAQATIERLTERGLTVAVLETWWDVDEAPDLARLRDHLKTNPDLAPATRLALER